MSAGVPWVIRKNGYFYRHHSRGFTSSVFEAELYGETWAKDRCRGVEGAKAYPVTDFVSCADYAEAVLDRVEAIVEAVKQQNQSRP